MEFVVVRYPERRPVFIDGQEAGRTAQMLLVEEGHHVLDLGEPRDYRPDRLDLEVRGTSAVTPLELAFRPQAARAGRVA